MKFIIPRNFLYCLILILLTLFAYANSFENSFHYDDFHVIVKNPFIKDLNNIPQFFLNPQLGSGIFQETSSYRPILMITFALNYLIGGVNSFGYHLFNFTVHIFASLFVYFIALFFLKLTFEEKNGQSHKNQWAALLAALIFSLHPLQVESVTYITGRSCSLTALFFLGSFWAYLRYIQTKQGHFLFWSSLSYACALLVKETAVTLLVLLILFHLFYPSLSRGRQRLISMIPFVLLTAFYAVIRMRFFTIAGYTSREPIRPIYDNLLTQLGAWVHSLGVLFLPLNLNVDYQFPISHSFGESRVLLSIVILIAAALAIWKIAKTLRPVGFFALWFAVLLLPTSSIIPLEDVITDRWLYLPSVGYAMIIAFLLGWIFQAKMRSANRGRKIIFLFCCFLLVELYGFGTVLRNFAWTSEWTLWEDAVSKSPNKARPHVALGLALVTAGRLDQGIREFQKALQIDPQNGGAYLNLGYAYYHQGKNKEAIENYQKALGLATVLSSEIHNDLGLAYLKEGREEESLKEFQKAIEIRPHNAYPYYNLGNYFEKKGDINQAISFLEKAIKLEPEIIPIHKTLSQLYSKKGWKGKSLQSYKNYLKYSS